jgi:ABC-type multidrug transport system permease subunit
MSGQRLTERGISERERMSPTLSQIASVVAGVALLASAFTFFVYLPDKHAHSLTKGLAVSVSLALLGAVLIALVRSYGS